MDRIDTCPSPVVADSRWFQRLIPTGDWVLALLAPTLVFMYTGLQRTYQTDFWHHLARGRFIVTEGRLLNEDRFTYTVAGAPLQDANWLSQVIYYGLYSQGGLALVQLVNSLVLSVMVGLLVLFCRRTSGSLRLGAALGVFCAFGLWQVLVIRPQTFSLLLFVLLYMVLDGSGRRPWLLLVPPVIMGLWVNLHGGFPIGVLPIGCFLLGAAWEAWWARGWGVLNDRATWRLGLCLVGCILATLVNPYGYSVYEYVGTVSTVASGRPILEWQAPGVGLLMSKVWVASLLLLIVACSLSSRRLSSRELFLILCFLPLSCGALRMVAWWLLISAPIIAAQLGAALPSSWLINDEDERPSVVAGLFVALFGLLALGSAPVLAGASPLPHVLNREHRLENDLAAIGKHLPADDPGKRRIFSQLEWGEYLGWSLAPAGYTVFIDGRIEIFPAPIWDEFMAVTQGRADWQQILDRYQVDYLILPARDLDVPGSKEKPFLVTLVEQSGAWKQEAQEGDILLFARRGANAKRQAADGIAQ